MVGSRTAAAGDRRRPPRRRSGLIAGVLVPLLLVAGACGQPARDRAAPEPEPAEAPAPSSAVPAPGVLSADEVKQAPALPPAVDLGELAEARAEADVRPLSVTIDRIGLDGVAVQAVGVEPTGEMSIPPPREVGWYRYGPLPGGAGSAVLAGHIASGGIDGAFRHLDRLEPGDPVEVTLSDGRLLRFVVTDTVQVGKTELPFDELFARSGPPKLALITCGGEFDYSARSYRDNVVVVAELAS